MGGRIMTEINEENIIARAQRQLDAGLHQDSLSRLMSRETRDQISEIYENLDALPKTLYAELSEGEIDRLADVVSDRLEDLFDSRFGEIERQLQSIVDSLPER